MRVAKAALGQLEELARGGFGVVYDAPAAHMPALTEPVVYKEFTSRVDEQAASAERAVTLRESLSPRDRSLLDEGTVWPRAVVTDSSGVAVGVVMPRLDDDFFANDFDIIEQQPRRAPRDVGHVMLDASQRLDRHITEAPPGELDRLVLVARVVHTIALLHRLGLVYGDLSLTNIVYTGSPPRIKVIDCDGVAPLADPLRQMPHTIGWEVPEQATGPQDDRSDTYKLGLLVLRCLLSGTPGLSRVTLLRRPDLLQGAVDDALARTITAALANDPADRPPAKELYAALLATIDELSSPPSFTVATLVTPVCPRGTDLVIEWEVRGAHRVDVVLPSGETRPLPSVDSGRLGFPVTTSGDVGLVATNEGGKTSVSLGWVTAYSLPDVGEMSVVLPTLPVPQLEAPRLLAPGASGHRLRVDFPAPHEVRGRLAVGRTTRLDTGGLTGRHVEAEVARSVVAGAFSRTRGRQEPLAGLPAAILEGLRTLASSRSSGRG